ncbi:MAG: glutamate racemase [Gemmatimonadota bacterium]
MSTSRTQGAIGVFDSGLGGLTVARALLETLPCESLLYVGDTARVPYGPKSPETVRRYASQIAEWLVDEGVKAIVVACNTATAHALDLLQQASPVPVIGVVDPGARAAVDATPLGRIGVIGTAGTIASGAYERAIHALRPDAEVLAQACALFVPLVEEGWVDGEATRLIAHTYLAPMRAAGVRSLVLGCTHYPLLAPVIGREMGPEVALIDSAAETAAETARVLQQHGIAASAANVPHHRFIASDAPDRFLALGRRFLGATLADVEHVPFG